MKTDSVLVDKKYLIHVPGKYHKGVTDCPYCDHEPETIYEHIVGFYNASIGVLCVIECPKCFMKWSFHARTTKKYSHYYYFLQFIKEGMNKHFNN